MSVRDDFQKAIADLRSDLKDGDEHLRWLLGELERHLDLSAQRAAEVAGVADESVTEDETADLSKLTVAELKIYAEENGVDVGDVTKKADILAAIETGSTETEDES